MLIKELAKRTGLSVHTIRFYEKSGLIKGKHDASIKTNNYLRYSEQDVEKLELISDAKLVGFTLKEIASLMDAWYNKRMSTNQKLAIMDAKLIAIDERITQLKDMKKLLATYKKSVQSGEC
jgi:MerR family transcriptional regulator, copper efflux regulator